MLRLVCRCRGPCVSETCSKCLRRGLSNSFTAAVYIRTVARKLLPPFLQNRVQLKAVRIRSRETWLNQLERFNRSKDVDELPCRFKFSCSTKSCPVGGIIGSSMAGVHFGVGTNAPEFLSWAQGVMRLQLDVGAQCSHPSLTTVVPETQLRGPDRAYFANQFSTASACRVRNGLFANRAAEEDAGLAYSYTGQCSPGTSRSTFD